jgi:hypothetical protein
VIVLELQHLSIWVKNALSWHYRIKSELNFLCKKYENRVLCFSAFIYHLKRLSNSAKLLLQIIPYRDLHFRKPGLDYVHFLSVFLSILLNFCFFRYKCAFTMLTKTGVLHCVQSQIILARFRMFMACNRFFNYRNFMLAVWATKRGESWTAAPSSRTP